MLLNIGLFFLGFILGAILLILLNKKNKKIFSVEMKVVEETFQDIFHKYGMPKSLTVQDSRQWIEEILQNTDYRPSMPFMSCWH